MIRMAENCVELSLGVAVLLLSAKSSSIFRDVLLVMLTIFLSAECVNKNSALIQVYVSKYYQFFFYRRDISEAICEVKTQKKNVINRPLDGFLTF